MISRLFELRMDRLKRARGTERAAATRLITFLEAEMQKIPLNRPQLEASLQLLDRRSQKLLELDEQVIGALLDETETTEAELEAESEAAEDYQSKAGVMKVKVNDVLFSAPQPAKVSPPHSLHSDSISSTSHGRRSYRLPKTELRKFSGELVDWLGWWASFQKIHQDEELHASDKFEYLFQCVTEGSRAHDLLKRYPQSNENYPRLTRH